MRILINERLSEHKYKTPEGYLICTDAIIARTGKQEYRKNEIFADSDDDSIIELDRPADEVFSEKTIASFENKPLVNEHPDEDVNTENYKDYAVGFIRDVHKGTVDGQDVLLANLVFTDKEAIEDIESGRKTELSCGYDCDIVDEKNPKQTNIRGNHVALCERGRAGIARIVDSVKDNSIFYKAYVDGKVYFSDDRAELEEMNPERIYVLEKDGDIIKDAFIKNEDSIQDVNPRSGESKEDFISRFMSETKEEYPDEKQRLAIAYSYWKKGKGTDSMVKDYAVEVLTGDGRLYDKVKINYNGRYDSEIILKEFYSKHPEYKSDRYNVQIVQDSTYDETPYEKQTEELEKSEERFEDGGFQEIGDFWRNLARKNKISSQQMNDIYVAFLKTPVYQNWSKKDYMDIIYSETMFTEFMKFFKRKTGKDLIVDSVKDSLSYSDIDVIEDAIYWVKKSGKDLTVKNVLKQIEEDMSGFIGSNRNDIINYLKREKHLRDTSEQEESLYNLLKANCNLEAKVSGGEKWRYKGNDFDSFFNKLKSIAPDLVAKSSLMKGVILVKKSKTNDTINDANIKLIGFKIEFIEGRHNKPNNILSMNNVNNYLKNENAKLPDNYVGYDKCYVDMIFEVDGSKYNIHGARVDLDGKPLTTSQLLNQDDVNEGIEFLERYLQDGNTRYGMIKKLDSINDAMNGKLSEFNPKEFINKIQQRKQALYTERDVNGKTYTIHVDIDGLFYDKNPETVYIDVYDENNKRKTYTAKSWDEAVRVLENVKRDLLKTNDSVKDATELSAKSIDDLDEQIKRYQKLHPTWKFGEIRKERGLYRVNVITDSMKDAQTYVIKYKLLEYNTMAKREFKANSVEEALKKFAREIALEGIGTYNVFVGSISPNDGYISLYGRLSKLLDEFNIKWYDSVKDSKHIKAIKAIKAIKQHQDSKLKDDYSGFLGNYGFGYLKGSGDYEYWYYKDKNDINTFNRVVERIRKEYPSFIVSSIKSDGNPRIYIQKSKYGVKDSKVKDEVMSINVDLTNTKVSKYDIFYTLTKALNNRVKLKKISEGKYILTGEKDDLKYFFYSLNLDSSKYIKDSKVKDYTGKLAKAVPEIVKYLKASKSNIENHAKFLVKNKNYKDFTTRILYDVFYKIKNSGFNLDKYYDNPEDAKDIYIASMMKQAFKEAGISYDEKDYQIKDSKAKDEYVRTPRGTFLLVNKTEEELRKEGYGYHHSGNGYKVFVKNNEAVAIKE